MFGRDKRSQAYEERGAMNAMMPAPPQQEARPPREVYQEEILHAAQEAGRLLSMARREHEELQAMSQRACDRTVEAEAVDAEARRLLRRVAEGSI